MQNLNLPVLLMNLPLSLSTQIANNAWMEDISPSQREVDFGKAFAQFFELYRHIAQHAVVYLLPSTPGLQDQPYVSNLGVVLPHLSPDTVIISRFRSEPRVGEAQIGLDFFTLLNFVVKQPPEIFNRAPTYFEGEADLKHIRGNLYVGAHGLRTSRNALRWFEDNFAMKIIPLRLKDPYLYHLDCTLFRVADDAVLLCTSMADQASIRAIEQYCEIVDVSLEQALAGVTNGLLLPGEILCDLDIAELDMEHPRYAIENRKMDFLDKLCSRYDRTLHVFSMSEYYKSGARLSCLIMHMMSKRDGAGELQAAPLERRLKQPIPPVTSLVSAN